jgi:dGTPase
LKKSIRETQEDLERQILGPYAAFSAETRGRLVDEPPCDVRPAFQRDRDRILHCKSFRRLKHKTQVFFSPTGDHYRTRLTHTLEVSQIARTIGKALRLNESLVEAIALGHDLGHTPFGHIGEDILNELVPGGFKHSAQSLRVVDVLENDGRGLNLTMEVRDGILKHSKGQGSIFPEKEESRPLTLEAEVVRISDIIAYINHDIDDAIRASMLKEESVVGPLREAIGMGHSRRISWMVHDVIESTAENVADGIKMSPGMLAAAEALRDFLYENVYRNEISRAEFVKAERMIKALYAHVKSHPETFCPGRGGEDVDKLCADFIAGMTDPYAVNLYLSVFVPKPWSVL